MKLKPLPKIIEQTQVVFNKFIRERDKNKGCISCGGPVENAGHYFPVKNHEALRFDPMNVHGQCVACNKWKYGNLAHYRIGLVRRYGEGYVKELEDKLQGPKIKKFTREELFQIQVYCKIELKKIP